MLFKIVVLALISFLKCDCANILGIIPTQSYSHQIAYLNFWKELSLKGHKVTVLTANPQNNPKLTNLTEIDLSIGYDILENEFNWSKASGDMDSLKLIHFLNQALVKSSDSYLNLPDVQKLIYDKSLHFDVVIVENIFSEFLMFGEVFNAPTIIVSSFEPPNQFHEIFQNNYHPFVYPDSVTPFSGDLSLKGRLGSLLFALFRKYISIKYNSVREEIIHKYFGNVAKPVEVLKEKSSMMFIFVNPMLLNPRPLASRTIVVGGETIIQEPKKLNKDIQNFLDSASNGAIYFSLGTNANAENLGLDALNGIIRVLEDLPYSVLWKFDNGIKYDLPRNVMTAKWLPQQDILRHPNIKLFITQGGLQSLEEAIYFKKPLIGIPIYADQTNNVKRLERKGVLKVVSAKPSLDPDAFRKAILEVIANSTYSENIQNLRDLSLDQQVTGLEKAIWWTEYVIRHKGNLNHMINNAAKTVPFYQYYLIDIFLLLLVSLLSFLGLIYLVASFIVSNIFRRGNLSSKKNQ